MATAEASLLPSTRPARDAGVARGSGAGAAGWWRWIPLGALLLGAGSGSLEGEIGQPGELGGSPGWAPQVERLPAPAQGGGEAAERPGGVGLFDERSVLEIGIEAPWNSLLRKRRSRPSVEGKLVYADAGGARVELDVVIKTRGKWRLEFCKSPPLTLTLEGGQIASTPFAGQGVLHASTPCFAREKYEQHLVQEYMIYRMYALLTEASLRARLVAVEYRDTDSGKPPRRGPAVLVEDIGLAAERLGRRWIEVPSVGLSALDPEATVLFALFQYMIGHTDWAVLSGPPGDRCCHNAALLARPGPPVGLLPLPYDFDASGLVNTGDVKPSEHLAIRSVRERLYRGFCEHNPRLPGAIERLNRARPEIEALIDEGDLLTPTVRDSTLRYLQSFYDTINSPAELEARILSVCRE